MSFEVWKPVRCGSSLPRRLLSRIEGQYLEKDTPSLLQSSAGQAPVPRARRPQACVEFAFRDSGCKDGLSKVETLGFRFDLQAEPEGAKAFGLLDDPRALWWSGRGFLPRMKPSIKLKPQELKPKAWFAYLRAHERRRLSFKDLFCLNFSVFDFLISLGLNPINP